MGVSRARNPTKSSSKNHALKDNLELSANTVRARQTPRRPPRAARANEATFVATVEAPNQSARPRARHSARRNLRKRPHEHALGFDVVAIARERTDGAPRMAWASRREQVRNGSTGANRRRSRRRGEKRVGDVRSKGTLSTSARFGPKIDRCAPTERCQEWFCCLSPHALGEANERKRDED